MKPKYQIGQLVVMNAVDTVLGMIINDSFPEKYRYQILWFDLQDTSNCSEQFMDVYVANYKNLRERLKL